MNRYLLTVYLYLIASVSYNTEKLRVIGYISIIMILVIMLYCLIKEGIYTIDKRLSIYFLLLTVYSLTLTAKNPTVYAVNCFFSVISIILTFLYVSQTIINTRMVRSFFVCITLLAIVLGIPFFYGYGFSEIDNGYKGIYSTTTFMGLFSYFCFALCIGLKKAYSSKKKNLIISIVTVCFFVITFLSKVRTAMIGITLIILCRACIKYMNKNLQLLKYILALGSIFFVMLYTKLDTLFLYDYLSEVVYDNTGKVLLSGREKIWSDAFECIKESILCGYGLDYSYAFNVPVHNSYLNILLSGGLIYFVLICLILNRILDIVIYNKKEYIYCFSLINLLLCNTEVVLTSGQIILQMLIWGGLAFGCNKSNANEYE